MHNTPTFSDLHIQGAPAAINEDERFWPTILMFCANRKAPDSSWDPVGTVEFTLKLPVRELKQKAALKMQAAMRGMQGRRVAALARSAAALQMLSASVKPKA